MIRADESEAPVSAVPEAAEQTAVVPALLPPEAAEHNTAPPPEEAIPEIVAEIVPDTAPQDAADSASEAAVPDAALRTMELPALEAAEVGAEAAASPATDGDAAMQTMEVPALPAPDATPEAAVETGELPAVPTQMPAAPGLDDTLSGEATVARIALRNLLDRPSLARLWEEVRKKLEQQGEVGGTVRLLNADDAERVAIANLLGLHALPEGTVNVRLDLLDRTLADSRFEIGLEAAMTLLGGPLRNRPAERAADDARRAAMWRTAHEHPVVEARPALGRWLEALEGDGLLKRLADGGEEALLGQALEVLTALPAPNLGLPAFANQVLGSSHGLDSNKPVATLVLRALSVLADRPPPSSAPERRDLWAWAGVICDDLSCDVLALGLVPEGDGLIPDWMRSFAAAGEPLRLTLRQITRTYIALAPGTRVHVCENPAVVAAAADRLGAATAPLLCVGGFLNTAARTLLWSLAQGGAQVTYHGDFDWSGIQIANNIYQVVPFAPWRYEAADYLRAMRAGADSLQLAGRPVEAAWDAALAEVMTGKGLAVEEEAVLEMLLTDLDLSTDNSR